MKKLIKIVISCGFLSAMPVAVAGPLSELKDCASIERDLKRLFCFDKKIKNINRDGDEIVSSSSNLTKNKIVEPVIQSNKKDSFGFENKIANESSDEIHSSIAGEFRGWMGNTVFKLTNGQVWKQIDSGKMNTRKMNPKIIIKKGAMGSYRLKVEGLNTRVAVKRIK